MNQNPNRFSEEEIQKLLATKEAMALAAILRQMDTSTLSRAAALASQGKSAEAKRLLEPLMQDPKINDLIRRMEEENG